jgi:hypothetical protein
MQSLFIERKGSVSQFSRLCFISKQPNLMEYGPLAPRKHVIYRIMVDTFGDRLCIPEDIRETMNAIKVLKSNMPITCAMLQKQILLARNGLPHSYPFSSIHYLAFDFLTTRTIPHTEIDSDALQHTQLVLYLYACYRTTLQEFMLGTFCMNVSSTYASRSLCRYCVSLTIDQPSARC